MRRVSGYLCGAIAIAAIGFAVRAATGQVIAGFRIERVSDLAPPVDHASSPAVSGDGRHAAFVRSTHIFVRNRAGGTTTHVSMAAPNAPPFGANGASGNPMLSRDGRYIAFDSAATNLLSTTVNAGCVYIVDRDADTDGILDEPGAGRSILIASVSSTGQRPTQGSKSLEPSISSNGRFVAFRSGASNLVVGDTNGGPPSGTGGFDVFVHDRDIDRNGIFDETGVGQRHTARVNLNDAGVQTTTASNSVAPVLSDDARFVAFGSDATNLVANDTNGMWDVFLRDRCVSGSGAYDVVGNCSTTRINVGANVMQANRPAFRPSMSGDGRYIAFDSVADNLVAGDTNSVQDVFMYDRATQSLRRISVGMSGVESNGFSFGASVSRDGRFVAFHSGATNLVSGDTNAAGDVFVWDRQFAEAGLSAIRRVSLSAGGGQADSSAAVPRISDSGGTIVFQSIASDLVPTGWVGKRSIFVVDRLVMNPPLVAPIEAPELDLSP